MRWRLLILAAFAMLPGCTDYTEAVDCVAAFTLEAELHGPNPELTRLRGLAVKDAGHSIGTSEAALESDIRAATDRLREQRRTAGAAEPNDRAFERCWNIYQ
jgi:hypothetical protein